MRRRLSLLLLCLAAAGCSDPTTEQTPEAIMPLAVGNSWTYEVSIDTGGQHVAYTSTSTVTGLKTIDGEDWYVVTRSRSDNPGRSEPLIYGLRSDGLYNYWVPALTIHAVKYPASVGDTFRPYTTDTLGLGPVGQPPILTREWYYTLRSRSKLVTVPAGTFETYYYSYHDIDSTRTPFLGDAFNPSEIYYRPGIGLIYSMSRQDSTAWKLVSYHVQ